MQGRLKMKVTDCLYSVLKNSCVTGSSCGYAFVEFETEREMRHTYLVPSPQGEFTRKNREDSPPGTGARKSLPKAEKQKATMHQEDDHHHRRYVDKDSIKKEKKPVGFLIN
ncbi:hypothetical protein HPP92_002428 [Vanilla planifolia]|uniref:Uncharacterized protein n=1 Tax=Vanilla planifolia TaxID=51239 RepID=A0A835S1S0_VANPL|nr:hypothetical protein HPP92_002428 [Vanilla planifolia]